MPDTSADDLKAAVEQLANTMSARYSADPQAGNGDATLMGALIAEAPGQSGNGGAATHLGVRSTTGGSGGSGGSGGTGGAKGGGSGGSSGQMSLGEFEVALGDLHAAIQVVRSESGHVSGLIGQIQGRFEAAHSYWQSPSASSFETMATWFTNSSRALEELLNEMAGRMQTAYDNYVNAERSNSKNLGG